jgi:predicted permease
MTAFLHHLALGAPLFALILVGYLLMRFAQWPQAMAQHLTTFVFSVGLPALLFRMMSDLSTLPPVDGRLLVAFFGGCLLVFLLGRLIAWKLFGLDGIGQSVFGVGCIFSNNIMLGLPLARASLGDPAIPSVALVLLFNALILWTLVSLSVEWHRHGSLSFKGFRDTLKGVLRNPIILAILAGTAFGLTGASLPDMLDTPLKMLGQTGMPLALVALGMSLAEYDLKAGGRSAWPSSFPSC